MGHTHWLTQVAAWRCSLTPEVLHLSSIDHERYPHHALNLARTQHEVQHALHQGANPNDDDALTLRGLLEKRTPFWGAMRDVVDASLAHGLDVLGRNDNHQTLLHYCADIPAIHALINAGAEINAMDCSSKTPFQYMCMQRKWEAAGALLQQGGVAGQRHISSNDMSNIFISALSQWRAGSNPSLMDLLERLWPYVDVGMMASSSLKSLLHMQVRMICAQDNAPSWARQLFQQLAVHQITSCMSAHPLSFPLWEAARRGDVFLVAYMLDQGQSVSQHDGHGNTALHAAVAANQFEAAELLLAKGADCNAANKYKQTPMFYLHYPYLSDADIQVLLVGPKGVDVMTALLLDYGAHVEGTDCFGRRIPSQLPLPPHPWRGPFLKKALEHMSYNLLMSHHQHHLISDEVASSGRASKERKI